MVAPPGSGIAAKGLSGMFWIGGPAWFGVENAHLEHVARLRAPHIDRAGADMHAETLAGATAEQ